MKCKYEFERSVNQVLWESVFDGYSMNYLCTDGFENDTFKIKPYSWDDEADNDYNFWHKPSGFKLQWYKYPLRSPMVNMKVSHELFLDILRDCHNSVHKSCRYDITEWWCESEVKKDG